MLSHRQKRLFDLPVGGSFSEIIAMHTKRLMMQQGICKHVLPVTPSFQASRIQTPLAQLYAALPAYITVKVRELQTGKIVNSSGPELAADVLRAVAKLITGRVLDSCGEVIFPQAVARLTKASCALGYDSDGYVKVFYMDSMGHECVEHDFFVDDENGEPTIFLDLILPKPEVSPCVKHGEQLQSAPRREMAPHEEAMVDDALSECAGGKQQVVSTFGNIPLTRHDIRTLEPGARLNDEIINYFMSLLANETWTHSCHCHFMSSHFYAKLAEGSSGEYCYKDVSRWTKNVDVFSKHLVFVPINCNHNHWTLAVINFVKLCFEYYDSRQGGEGTVLTNLRRWLEDEHRNKMAGAVFDVSEWRALRKKTPIQLNGTDCGVFMTRIAEYLARGLELNFTQSDMIFFRRQMVLEVMLKRILPKNGKRELSM